MKRQKADNCKKWSAKSLDVCANEPLMPMSFSVALFIPLFQTAGFENQHTIPRIDFFLSYLASIKILPRLTSYHLKPIISFLTFFIFLRTHVERIYARTTKFASLVLQTKDIVVFVPRDLRVIIVKRVSLLS